MATIGWVDKGASREPWKEVPGAEFHFDVALCGVLRLPSLEPCELWRGMVVRLRGHWAKGERSHIGVDMSGPTRSACQ